jgi:FMN reductase
MTGITSRRSSDDRTASTGPVVLAIVGNPRPESRTHGLARSLVREISLRSSGRTGEEVDLATIGSRVLEHDDPAATLAVERVLAADVLVVASPTYKATYSGLLKSFLDRFGTGALAGREAVPVMLGGAPDHRLAVDLHLTPLLLELGASVPARGLFVLESEVDTFAERAAAWVREERDSVRWLRH